MPLLPAGTGHVRVDAFGGRIAELRPGPDLPNLLWQGDTVPVLGGDRLWVAPEMDLFYGTDGSWRIPSDLDPVTWSVRSEGDGVRLDHTFRGAALSRRVRALMRPPVLVDLPWAGYTVEDIVTTDEPWSAWHLVMLPVPATLSVRASADPVVYYPPAPEPVDGGYPADGRTPRWKLGFAPPSDGRVVLAGMGDADPGPLVVVLTDAPSDGTYVDRPPDGGPATAVQIFDAGGEGFCELEHHAPLETRRTTSTVFGVWGPRTHRDEILAALV